LGRSNFGLSYGNWLKTNQNRPQKSTTPNSSEAWIWKEVWFRFGCELPFTIRSPKGDLIAHSRESGSGTCARMCSVVAGKASEKQSFSDVLLRKWPIWPKIAPEQKWYGRFVNLILRIEELNKQSLNNSWPNRYIPWAYRIMPIEYISLHSTIAGINI
jgi:hypothetical protein